MTARPPVRLAAFAVVLGVAFAAAYGLGRLIAPGGRGLVRESHGAGATGPEGLSASGDGLVLEAERTSTSPFRFRIVRAGSPVRDFDIEQDRPMHLIVVRRDLTGFQHLHPELGADGWWSIRLDLPAGGVYRAFADFATAGERHTLGIDVHQPGEYRPGALADGPPAGYEVDISRRDGRVSFSVREAGGTVAPEPYLGALGHLVALRQGDLAYAHTHPDPGGLVFDVEYPGPGTYRLFLQFRHRGAVHTAPFTVEVP